MNAFEELREGLRAAAQRDIAANRARRRRRRRVTVVLVLALIGGGAAAEATDLLDTGAPAPERAPQGSTYRPADQRQIAAKVRVDGVPLPFGVTLYDANNGMVCALAGVLNGTKVGDFTGGRFHPFGADRPGACRAPGKRFFDWTAIAGRAVLFGVASPGTREVVLRETGQTAKVGKAGAFLFVLPHLRPITVDERE